MKILERGTYLTSPPPDQRWVYTVVIYCGHCGTRYQVEPLDQWSIIGLRLHSTCPECRTEVVTPKPRARGFVKAT